MYVLNHIYFNSVPVPNKVCNYFLRKTFWKYLSNCLNKKIKKKKKIVRGSIFVKQASIVNEKVEPENKLRF